jgi:hypothetical protein
LLPDVVKAVVIGFIAVVGMLSGCFGQGAFVYLIPDGFEGPVVVVWGVPDGTDAATGSDLVLQIPSDGVLRVAAEPGGAGHRLTFIYVNEQGERAFIPSGRGLEGVHVFGYISGSMTRGVDGREWRYEAFMVGEEREGWGTARLEAVDRALAPLLEQ